MALLIPMMATAYSPKKEALLVGVGLYEDGDKLPGIEKDIYRMKQLLSQRGFNVRVLFNEQATVQNVSNALKSYRSLSSNDSFIFYDSSHGTQVPDLNGEESDGLDEAYVLYDVNNPQSNFGLLIDDQLETLLANIPAKKVMLTDTCHSGSMYKSFTRNARTKSRSVGANFKFVNKDGILGSVPKVKNLVSLAASSDHEKSIATSGGSLFTEAIYDAWSSKPKISFKEMQQDAKVHIANMSRYDTSVRPHTPTLYTTNSYYLNEPVNDFLQINITVNPKKYLVEEYLDELMQHRAVETMQLSAKSVYANQEPIQFNINTGGKQGHLYILTVKESANEIDVLYPNPYYQNPNEQWRGSFAFPNAHTPFTFLADNKSSGVERTVVYAILSESMIPELEVSRVGYNKFQSIFKDFQGQANLKNAFKDILIRKKANQITIAKKVFSVGV